MRKLLSSLDPLQKNILLLWSRNALFSSAFIFGSMMVLQSYLKQLAVSDVLIGLLNTIINITQVLVMLLYMGKADACKDPIKFVSKTITGQLVLPVCVIVLCLIYNISTNIIIVTVFTAVLVQNIYAGLRMGIESKIYAYMSTQQALGRVMGIDGIIAGVCNVLSGLLLAPLLIAFLFPNNIALAFAACMLMLALSAFINKKIVLFNYVPSCGTHPLQSLKEIIKMAQFKKLLFANFARGIAQAGGYFMLPVGVFRLQLEMKHTSLIVSCVVWATIISSLMFTFLIKKFKTRILFFASALLGTAGFVMLVTVTSIPAYIAACFLVMLSQGSIDRSIAMGNYEIVPREQTGAFSAVRISVTFLTNAVASAAIGWCIGNVSLLWVYLAVGAILLAGGFLFLFRQGKFIQPEYK